MVNGKLRPSCVQHLLNMFFQQGLPTTLLKGGLVMASGIVVYCIFPFTQPSMKIDALGARCAGNQNSAKTSPTSCRPRLLGCLWLGHEKFCLSNFNSHSIFTTRIQHELSGGFKYVHVHHFSPRKLGEDEPILTICFDRVVQPTNKWSILQVIWEHDMFHPREVWWNFCRFFSGWPQPAAMRCFFALRLGGTLVRYPWKLTAGTQKVH